MNSLNKEAFLEVPAKLKQLKGTEKPLWGQMTPQHMVEHLVGSWRISNGRARVKCMFEGEQLAKRRAFLFSDTPYQRNITNPVQGDGLPKLRKPDYTSAVDQLADEMKEFFDYHASNPEAIEIHPVFGDLDFNEWLVFQTKHMEHHLRQFDIEIR